MSSTLSKAKVEKMKVDQLKVELKRRSLSPAGKKQELVDRLLAALSPVESVPMSEPFEADDDSKTDAEPATLEKENITDAIAPTVDVQAVETDPVAIVDTSSDKADPLSSSENESSYSSKEFLGATLTAGEASQFNGSETLAVSIQEETEITSITAIEEATSQAVVELSKEEAGSNDNETQNIMVDTAVEESNLPATSDESNIELSGLDTATFYVRIDNFQRPLTVKSLIAWLEQQTGLTISTEDLWINSIKTHCYIDFGSKESARLCIERIKGQRWPPNESQSSSKLLEADFTSVSSKAAPTSHEATLRPGAWKTVPKDKEAPMAIKGHNRSPAAADPSLHQPIHTNTAAPLSSTLPPPVLTSDSGSSILQRIKPISPAVGLFGVLKNAAAAAAKGAETTSRQGHVSTGIAGRLGALESKNISTGAGLKREREREEPLSLEKLFSKTAFAPQLFWKPAPNTVVEERKRKRVNNTRV